MTAWHPRRVGFFVLGGLALAVVGVVLLGGGRFFLPRHRFVSYFSPSAVIGLRIGSLVRFRGIPVGEVRAMHLTLGRSDRMITSVPVEYELDERRIARDVPGFEITRAVGGLAHKPWAPGAPAERELRNGAEVRGPGVPAGGAGGARA